MKRHRHQIITTKRDAHILEETLRRRARRQKSDPAAPLIERLVAHSKSGRRDG
jgi:hypothetical protein